MIKFLLSLVFYLLVLIFNIELMKKRKPKNYDYEKYIFWFFSTVFLIAFQVPFVIGIVAIILN